MNPQVFILSRPQFTDGYQEFLSAFYDGDAPNWRETLSCTAAERLVEFAGRVCYMSFGMRQSPKSNREYIKNLIQSGHESVLEHAVWTFAVCGVSRAFTHQLVRHRAGFSFSQLSQQYHDESDAHFIEPPGVDRSSSATATWRRSMSEAHSAYKEILKELDSSDLTGPASRKEKTRAIRSIARSVLPNSTATAIVLTANARALRHFFKSRGYIVGDYEMRMVAAAIFKIVQPEGPALFYDFVVDSLEDEFPAVLHRSENIPD